ncbi:RES domain-containing protein [Pseudomonas sp. B21-032]|uniref:RES domain-containing protein n=1 Tax=Pseudomonas sp. B21-032 TaxID=2895483 RepID=UPI00215FEE44|nr:RES domain-containing protein [Pseudomonas sp. B21-032]UVL60845.1 RES domain-containing protein [Pseudomonas sp. B21-032]
MHNITHKFPPLPLSELIARIERFSEAKLHEKHSLISDLVKVHPLLSMDFGAGSVFRRARKIDEHDYPSSVQDFLWRVGGKPSVGRANPEGFPVLYIADRPETAFSETHISDNFVLLSELRIREGAKCRIAPIGEMLQVQRTGRGFLSGDASVAINNMLNACSIDQARSLLITDAFLFECLVGDDEKYLVSSFVSEAIFKKNRKISAVAYPSVRQHGAINFAVRIDDFWDSWSVVAARRMRARHLACGYYETTRTEHVLGITAEGKLVWGKGKIEDNIACRLEPPWHPGL